MANEELRRIKTFVGATGRKLRFQLRDPSTGAAYDLTGFSAATISARLPGEATYKIQAAVMTIEAGTDGWLYFYPIAGHIDTAADLKAQIYLDSGTDEDYSDKLIIEVEAPEHYVP